MLESQGLGRKVWGCLGLLRGRVCFTYSSKFAVLPSLKGEGLRV